jgi:hypothetical protein
MKKVIIIFMIIFDIIALNAQTKKQKQQEEREIDSIFITNVAEYVHYIIYPVNDYAYFSTRYVNIDSILFYKSGNCVSYHSAFTYFVLSEIKNNPNIKIYAVDGAVKPEYNYNGGLAGHRITLVEFYGTKYYFDVGWGVYWSKTLPKHMKEDIEIIRIKYKNLKMYKETDEDLLKYFRKCSEL